MTIKHLIKILEDLKEKYGNMPIERLMQIESIPFYIKYKSKKEINNGSQKIQNW